MTIAFMIALFLIALRVAVGLWRKQNMWRWIAVYWTVLTVKNLLDIVR